MTRKLNVLLADDHDYFLDGLQADIKKIPNVNKIFRANTGIEILEIVEKNKVDILISDIQMPKLDGIKAAMKLKNNNKPIKFIFLTSYYDIQHIKPLVKLDVKVILDKENVKSEIFNAMNAVIEGRNYYTKLIQVTINDILKGKRKSNIKTGVPALTKREKELLKYFTKGLSNKEIAKKVMLSPATIDTHRTNIYFKFDVNSSAKFIIKALEYGLIDV